MTRQQTFEAIDEIEKLLYKALREIDKIEPCEAKGRALMHMGDINDKLIHLKENIES